MSAPLPKVFVQDLPPKGGYPIIKWVLGGMEKSAHSCDGRYHVAHWYGYRGFRHLENDVRYSQDEVGISRVG